MCQRRWNFFAWDFMILSLCYSDQAPKYSFVHKATEAPPTSYYDYIVVGGGTAGCPLAATLSESATVLLLERGGSPYGNPDIIKMESFGLPIADPSPESPAENFVSEDGVFNTRARVLGGGSALNAGFYTHASWEYVSRAGWYEPLVNDSYRWVEAKVAFEPRVTVWQSAVREGLLEAGVLPDNGFTYDHIAGTKIGGTIFDGDDNRHTAADLLEYAVPHNIDVYLHATVHKILISKKGKSGLNVRAYGIEFGDSKGNSKQALLKGNPENEVIVSAGAIGSPHLLMLSGVGPANHLRDHGIEVVVNNPMVGQGIADNPMNILFVPSPVPVELSLIQVVGITKFGSFIETCSGTKFFLRILAGHKALLNETANSYSMDPELTVKALKGLRIIAGNKALLNKTDMTNIVEALNDIHSGIILEKIIGPNSYGEIRLRSADPNQIPSVKFNYFQDPEDLKRCVRGMHTIIDVFNSKSFSKFRFKILPADVLMSLVALLPLNLRPRHLNTATDMEQFCIDTVMTIWHYHGGCQVGKVVDSDYKVIGVDGLRVIDGSTFLASPGTNPQATVMMLGRYMGRKIQEG